MLRSSNPFKEPLITVRAKYARQKRLKGIISFLNSFCEEKFEDKGDVLLFLLCQHLQDKQDQRAKSIDGLWSGLSYNLTVDQCLALRVDTRQTKGQYKSQYDFLKQKLANNVLQPPLASTERELAYMPGSVRYIVQSEDLNQTYYHTPVKQCAPVAGTAGVVSDPSCEPLNILGDFHDSVPEFPSPNVKGVRFKYIDALAKTLQELDPIVKAGLGELNLDPGTTVLKTTVKDGADGMGDVSVYKETGDRFLPDKSLSPLLCCYQN